MASERFEVVEICAGAGGQSLGLHRAGFQHRLAVELDVNAAATLRHNLARLLMEEDDTLTREAADEAVEAVVKVGDVASPHTWAPDDYQDVDLLAGGVPCPPFSIAGKQLGATDERDLFAWAVELCGRVRPKALLLENVKGLSGNRFSAYRQHVLERLHKHGYTGEWRLLNASDYGVSQLRPRFVLVALQQEYAEYFSWPDPDPDLARPVGDLLRDLMGQQGWKGLEKWVKAANGAEGRSIAPTIVGGSKKHGGADLGPTRAKVAWALLGVDAMGVANESPDKKWVRPEGVPGPKLTTAMVARIQGWDDDRFRWEFLGRKTSVYRQIGNAFPPPVAEAVGASIARALRKEQKRTDVVESVSPVLDPVYALLRGSGTRALSAKQIVALLEKAEAAKTRAGTNPMTALSLPEVERRIAHIGQDFDIVEAELKTGELTYRLGEFKAFVGQQGHARHDLFAKNQAKIS
ncbi:MULTISPECIES: DNA cytosine methyltransferase [Streptacidiphilus]|uniref:Cytosine-specific methyltransferase n=1 Tax=Streptacidiphilus cavernicola TaxID=3342716 RepID=A0ABV6UFM5_9ACTN|nr:DNA (cytosine-5-)-methyltransferase [Streptacidiphilus jeojiense]